MELTTIGWPFFRTRTPTFRKKLYGDLETLQIDLDEWLVYYNNEKTHQGKMCNGRTPMETLLSGKLIWDEKNLNQI